MLRFAVAGCRPGVGMGSVDATAEAPGDAALPLGALAATAALSDARRAPTENVTTDNATAATTAAPSDTRLGLAASVTRRTGDA
jgi:hypothetical protein